MQSENTACARPINRCDRRRSSAHRSVMLLGAVACVVSGCAVNSSNPASPIPSSPPAREGYLTAEDGARLFYRVVGRGVDTVVIVHGGPGAGMQAVYPDLLPLADRRVLVFYDQRGGGRSELPADTTRLGPREHVQDLEAVRRHFALERMTVMAHSFGAVVVAKYLEAHPERVSRLVFIGATGPRQAEAEGYYRAIVTGADTLPLKRRFGAMMALMQGTAPDVLASCRELAETGRVLSTARGEPARWKGSECDMPADALRYYFRYTARLGPALFGAGKGAPADRPETVLPAIDRFLRGEWPTEAQVMAE